MLVLWYIHNNAAPQDASLWKLTIDLLFDDLYHIFYSPQVFHSMQTILPHLKYLSQCSCMTDEENQAQFMHFIFKCKFLNAGLSLFIVISQMSHMMLVQVLRVCI